MYNNIKVKRFQIVPLTDQTAVAIIVTDNGHVENRILTLPDGNESCGYRKNGQYFK